MIKWFSLRFPWLVDQVNTVSLLLQMRRRFRTMENPWKIPSTSRDYYNAYDDREHQTYSRNALTLCRVGNKNQLVPLRETRLRYLAPVFAQIDKALASAKKVNVLEVGCGNCINLVEISARYGDRVKLSGFDVSSGRIETAKNYFQEKLNGMDISVQSAIAAVPDSEIGSFDVVFSMHCLEQIPYAVQQAVEGMWKRARHSVVFVEPVWEFARPVQKLKLIRSDYVRTLLPTVRFLGYNIVRAEPLGFETSQKNQTSVIVLEK